MQSGVGEDGDTWGSVVEWTGGLIADRGDDVHPVNGPLWNYVTGAQAGDARRMELELLRARVLLLESGLGELAHRCVVAPDWGALVEADVLMDEVVARAVDASLWSWPVKGAGAFGLPWPDPQPWRPGDVTFRVRLRARRVEVLDAVVDVPLERIMGELVADTVRGDGIPEAVAEWALGQREALLARRPVAGEPVVLVRSVEPEDVSVDEWWVEVAEGDDPAELDAEALGRWWIESGSAETSGAARAVTLAAFAKAAQDQSARLGWGPVHGVAGSRAEALWAVGPDGRPVNGFGGDR